MQQVDIEEGRSRWFRWPVLVAALLVVAAIAAFFLHRAFAGGSDKTEPYQPYTVGTMTLRAMVTTSGVAVAQDEADLSFSRPGQVEKFYVKLGDAVKAGQPLMSIKSDDLQNAASTAQSALTLARLQLQKLQEGATGTDLARADEAVVTARAGLTKAQNDLSDALDPATDAKMTAAQQAVASAESALSAAQAKLDTLKNGATDADLAAAEASVVQAQAKLSQAQRSESDANDQEANAQSAYEYAATQYCDIDGALPDICQSLVANDYDVPLTNDQVDELSESVQPEPTATRTPGPSPTPTSTATPVPTGSPTPTRTPRPTAVPVSNLEQATGNLTYANNTYRTAITSLANAEDAVGAAQAALDAAQAALDQLEKGATPEDIAAAQKAVDSANAALLAARTALQELIDGATNTMVSDLSAAVDRAQADVQAAETARDELGNGATRTELAIQQEQVHRAELELQQADIALSDATLTSPFDGVVSSIPVKIGQVVNASIPAVTVLTPGTIIFELNIGETELPAIKVGQGGGVIFDAIQGKVYPISIFAVGLSPETQQGVIIYKVRAQILGDLGDPKPAPGMNGSASIVTEQRANVVAVPSTVVRSRGGEKIVEVVVDGKIEQRVVTTGLTDGDNVEIVSGLSVGDTIAMRTTSASATKTASQSQALPGGVR